MRINTNRQDCPYCNKNAVVARYYEGGHLVETDIKCKCGYHYSSSYGAIEITVPDGYEEGDE